MNQIEIYQVYLEYVHAVNGLWQIWLTITFAFIAAFHAGRKSITVHLTWVGCGLYFFSSCALILRYLGCIHAMNALQPVIVETGLNTLPENPAFGFAVYSLTTGTLVLGSLMAVGFAVYQYRSSAKT